MVDLRCVCFARVNCVCVCVGDVGAFHFLSCEHGPAIYVRVWQGISLKELYAKLLLPLRRLTVNFACRASQKVVFLRLCLHVTSALYA